VAEIPNELTQNMQIVDPNTNTATADLLRNYNALIRYLRALNERVTDLE
jgi:hypothetical protein